MIPKKIHYIWLGNKKKSNLSNICILSWKKANPEYEFIEWNETNLNLDELCNKNKFLSECRKHKLWAFMADYLRLYILYEQGGIYLDLDVYSIKSFNDCLENKAFIGYEYFSKDDDNYVTEGTGIIASEKGNSFIKECLNYYNEEIWNENVYYIPTIFTIVAKRSPNIVPTIYPVDYFAPYDYRKKFNDSCVTKNTICIHMFEGSWHENKWIGLFLNVKHIKNPIKKKLKQFKYYLGYIKRKIL